MVGEKNKKQQQNAASRVFTIIGADKKIPLAINSLFGLQAKLDVPKLKQNNALL